MTNSETAFSQLASSALRKAALNEDAKKYILNNEVIFTLLLKAAKRYIGGEQLTECVDTVKRVNHVAHRATVDFMGESIRNATEAREVTQEFIRLKHEIISQKLNSTISLDLSHIGLVVDRELALENMKKILVPVQAQTVEVIISAEGTDRTDSVLDVYKTLSREFDHVGITLQAYLHRSKDDFSELLKYPGKIRVVKGAFETPARLSMPRSPQLDATYLGFVESLLKSNHLCSIASHDTSIHETCKALIKKYQPTDYEFESLLGIGEDNLLQLASEGYPTRQYVVYGKEWYLYLCNRLAEYPPSIYQALTDVIG